MEQKQEEIKEQKETKKKNWFTSLFTDRDWDFDLTKVLGFCIVVTGIVGFFLSKADFQYIIAFGAGLIATGKFSKDG